MCSSDLRHFGNLACRLDDIDETLVYATKAGEARSIQHILPFLLSVGLLAERLLYAIQLDVNGVQAIRIFLPRHILSCDENLDGGDLIRQVLIDLLKVFQRIPQSIQHPSTDGAEDAYGDVEEHLVVSHFIQPSSLLRLPTECLVHTLPPRLSKKFQHRLMSTPTQDSHLHSWNKRNSKLQRKTSHCWLSQPLY